MSTSARGAEDDRPGKGDPVPDIALQTMEGDTVRPADFAGRKLVMFFYPRADTPGCTTESRDFTALKPEFDAAGIALLGISKDQPEKLRKFAAKYDLTVPLASDAAENGLADALGIWGEKSMYGRKYLGMARTTYLVDHDGRIAEVWRKVKVKGHADMVLAAARTR
jgi:thioredoxin-dependent peroxiredoxin